MNTRILKIGGSIFALALVSPAPAADTTLPAKNASGTTVQLKVQDDAGTLTPAHTVRCAANPAQDCVAQPQAVAGSDASTAIAVQGITGGKAVPVSIATAPVLVAGSAIIGKVGIDQTTDGTTNLVAAKQNGTWNVTNISGTVSLPTGAAIASKQPALGTAGSSSTDVITVQGISGGTNLNVNCQVGCSGGTSYTEDVPAPADPTGISIISRRRDTMSTSEVSADGDNIGLISTNKGELRVNDNSLNAVLGTAGDSGVTGGSPGTISGLLNKINANIALMQADTSTVSSNTAQINGVTVLTGTGNSGTGAQRVVIATDQPAFSVNVGTLPALPAGTNTIGATYGFAGTIKSTFNRPADANVYAVNDWISDSTTAPTSGGFTLTGACRNSGGSGIITDVIIGSNDTAAISGKVYILDAAATTTPLDNTLESANNFTDADLGKLVAEIPFSMTSRTSNALAHVQNLNAAYTCSGSANLRWLLQFTGGTTTTVSGNTYTLTVKFKQTN